MIDHLTAETPSARRKFGLPSLVFPCDLGG